MIPILYIKEGNLSFGDKTVLENIEIYINKGDKICLIGRNGSGKSSLMKLISGIYELDNGELFHLPGTSLGYLKQDIEFSRNYTIYDLILDSLKDKETSKYKVDIILENLELDGNLKLEFASGGQIRRATLAKVLVSEPDILLLDEPTNHLDIKTIEWLEEYVQTYSGAIICISHDRAFLAATTNKIWWIDRGNLKKVDKGFKYFDSWQEQIIKEEEVALRKLNKKLETENAWLSAGVTARRKRNQKRLAHLKSLRTQLAASTSKLNLAKQKLQISLSDEIKKTNFIIEAQDISFSYEDKKIVDNFTFRVKKGEKIGIIGPNGSGKSTFIKILIKEFTPACGYVKHGTNLDITYIDQYRSELNPHSSLRQILCPTGGDQVFLPGNRSMHVAAYLKQFMFDPKSLNDKVSTLSGGQSNRLLLAKALINPGNLLILDEPTNDLDMDSLEILLEILSEYNGTLIIVSHDRDFLDRLVTRTLIFVHNNIIDFTGGYEEYKKFDNQTEKLKQDKANKSIIKAQYIPNNQISHTTKKLSYKDQRALETIPEEIAKLEKRVKILEKEFENPDLFLQNPQNFNFLASELNEAQEKINQLTEEWMDISFKTS